MAILEPMSRAAQQKPIDTVQTIVGPVEVYKDPKGMTKGGAARRISAKMRKAITLRIRKGLSIKDACKLAEIQPSAYYKAILKPHVLALYEKEKQKYINSIEEMADRHKARALEVAAELLECEGNEQIRARMVEFFRAERKSGPSITINNAVNSGGYEYVGRGQRIVEIDGDAQDVTDSDG